MRVFDRIDERKLLQIALQTVDLFDFVRRTTEKSD